MLFKKNHEKRNILLPISFICLFSALRVFTRARTVASNSEENSSIPEEVKGERINTLISAVNADDPDRVRDMFSGTLQILFNRVIKLRAWLSPWTFYMKKEDSNGKKRQTPYYGWTYSTAQV